MTNPLHLGMMLPDSLSHPDGWVNFQAQTWVNFQTELTRGGTRERERAARASERLVRLNTVAPFVPLLIATRLQCPDDAAAYATMADACERYAFRVYLWNRRRNNAGQTVLYRLGHNLWRFGNMAQSLREVRRTGLGYCSDSQFARQFRDETIDWYDWWGIKYLLYEYEEHLARREGLTLRMVWDDLEARNKRDTIEHILPQTATAPYWAERFTQEDRARYTHNLGNLTLTYYNAELSNKPFDEKRGTPGEGRGYANSIVIMEQQLTRYEEWTPATIEARRAEIKAWALDRWHVEPAEREDMEIGTWNVNWSRFRDA